MVSLIAYGLVVAAFKLGPAGPVAAIRETSVVFAALIGWLFLGERLTPRRIAACAIVALGAVCLGYRPVIGRPPCRKSAETWSDRKLTKRQFLPHCRLKPEFNSP